MPGSVRSMGPGQLHVEWRLADYLSGVRPRTQGLTMEKRRLEVSDGGAWHMASTDRVSEETKVAAGFSLGVTLLIKDMIRESGDRGTNVLNFLINTCMFLASISIMLEDAKVPAHLITDHLCKIFKDAADAELLAEGDDGLHFLTKRFIESDWALWPQPAPTLPTAASAPSAACGTAAKSQGAMALPISWTPGSPGDCDFQAWEIFVMLQPRDAPAAAGGAWQLACYSILEQDTSCTVEGLLTGRSYDVRIRQVCSDPDATSPFAELGGAACVVDAVAAEAPANLTATSPGPYEVVASWDANIPWACIFQAWQVQVKSQAEDNWESGGLGCLSYDRDVTNCSASVGLGSNTPYDVRVRETCHDAAVNSPWLTLAFPGVSTPLPQSASAPQSLQVTQGSAFSIDMTWSAGDSGDCVFSAWSVELVAPDSLQQAIATCSSAPRLGVSCTATLQELNLIDTASSSPVAGTYHVRVQEICSDPYANSPWTQLDAAVILIDPSVPPSAPDAAAAGETWLALTWVPGFSSGQCSAIQWRVHWRRRVSGVPVEDWTTGSPCAALPCNAGHLILALEGVEVSGHTSSKP
ncbi:ANKRD50 [Symbiodinium natans]|uniref:ANKRD50 protein n=1 Tax=Symbiodinium natans TaxID=878477 RepID=A0A812L409_9DINO|nr:ANKRD50 [Symbiodinium natans]